MEQPSSGIMLSCVHVYFAIGVHVATQNDNMSAIGKNQLMPVDHTQYAYGETW